ncbi:MAG: Mur ligase family protein [Pirellulales bacterium]|nr:Mur ligase family protein [Pirellulales bacterium]
MRSKEDTATIIWHLAGMADQQVHNPSANAKNLPTPSVQGIVTDGKGDFSHSSWQVVVPDVANALYVFAAWRRQQFVGEVIALSGPIGKSTTRRMIEHLATVRFSADRVAAQPSIDEDQWSVPLLLANLGNQAAAVVECHTDEQLCLCDPTMAVLTSHPTTAGFGREIVSAEPTLASLAPKATVIMPANVRVDDDACVSVARIMTYGREAECDIQLREVRCGGGQLSFFVDEARVEIPVWGRHHAPAAAAAIAVARVWELPFLEIVTNLANFSSHTAGCSVFHHANMTFIKDTRHAVRDSLRAALEMLQEVGATNDRQGTGRKVVVCDSIIDTDDDSPKLSRVFGEQVCCVGGADLLLANGQHAEDVVNAAQTAGMSETSARVISTTNENKMQCACDTADCGTEIAATLQRLLRPGDTVLFKSGAAGRLEKVVTEITQETKFLPSESPMFGHTTPSASFV